mmetsp:Transcript_29292/g.56754  ORF Transcript_29292/g.56754 Transcript_29292/m.56754 type:complete len:339 (+) Transcript_29292:3-1019(+)
MAPMPISPPRSNHTSGTKPREKKEDDQNAFPVPAFSSFPGEESIRLPAVGEDAEIWSVSQPQPKRTSRTKRKRKSAKLVERAPPEDDEKKVFMSTITGFSGKQEVCQTALLAPGSPTLSGDVGNGNDPPPLGKAFDEGRQLAMPGTAGSSTTTRSLAPAETAAAAGKFQCAFEPLGEAKASQTFFDQEAEAWIANLPGLQRPLPDDQASPEGKVSCGIASHKHLKCMSYKPFLDMRCESCHGPMCFPKTYNVEVRRRRRCCFKYFLQKLKDERFKDRCKNEFGVTQKFLNKIRNTITKKYNRLEKGFGSCHCKQGVIMSLDALKRHRLTCTTCRPSKK